MKMSFRNRCCGLPSVGKRRLLPVTSLKLAMVASFFLWPTLITVKSLQLSPHYSFVQVHEEPLASPQEVANPFRTRPKIRPIANSVLMPNVLEPPANLEPPVNEAPPYSVPPPASFAPPSSEGPPVAPAVVAELPVAPAVVAELPVAPAVVAELPVAPAVGVAPPVAPAVGVVSPVAPAVVAGLPVAPAVVAGLPVAPAVGVAPAVAPAVASASDSLLASSVMVPSSTTVQVGKRTNRRAFKDAIFGKHLKEGCSLGNDGPKLCAVDTASYNMLRSYEKRRNLVTLAFVLLLLVLGVLFQLMLRTVASHVDKSNDKFLKNVMETVFRQLATIMLVIATILITLQFNFIEYELDQRVFGDIMEMFPAMSELFSESHLEMIFDELLLIAMIFTAVYIAFTVYYILIAWDTLHWLKRVDSYDIEKVTTPKPRPSWWCSSLSSAVPYICLRYEFQDSVESAGVPGIDPSGYYFMEYLRACLLKMSISLVRLPNATLLFCFCVFLALFPVAHWRHWKEIVLLCTVSTFPLLFSIGILFRLIHIKNKLLPKDPLTYASHRTLVEMGVVAEDLQMLTDIGPPYKTNYRKATCCCRPWTRLFCGTVDPTKHESLFFFWRKGPRFLIRLIEGCYFVQIVVLANLFYLLDRHWKTWWLLYGPWAPLAVFTIVGLQLLLLPQVMWNMVVVTSTSGLIDDPVLQEVWEHQRAETVRRSAQFVDQIRIDAALFEITSGGDPFWRRLVVASSTIPPEVEVQNEMIFSKLDEDGEGSIGMPQFNRWISSQGFSIPNEREAKRWFDVFDRDKNKRIDRTEFRVVILIVKRLLSEPMNIEAVLNLFGAKYGLLSDSHVEIDARLLQGILTEVNMKWTDSQAKHFMEYVTGQRGGGKAPVTEFVDKLRVLESETLATLQHAVGQLRNRKQSDTESEI